jgi:uncharacterized protein (DUF3084 family)
MRRSLLLVFVMCSTMASAQQEQRPLSPEMLQQLVASMAAQRNQAADAAAFCQAQLNTAAGEVTKLKERVAELEKAVAEKGR